MMERILIKLLFFVVINSYVSTSRVKIRNNGYDDILIALPPSIIHEKRTFLVSSLKRLFQQSSSVLLNATKGRAKFHSVSFLVPHEWGEIDSWLPNRDKAIVFEEPKAAFNREDVDIIIANPDEEIHPYTLHHQGCGKQSHRIYVPSNFSTTGNVHKRSIELVRLWSELRYGIFPEGGFEDDEKFPLTYLTPENRTIQETGCVNKPFRVPLECEVPWKCDGYNIIPSIMDHHYTNGTFFCEGHTSLGQIHNPDAPTKQNLLCNEEGTYYTVLRSPDFKNGKNAAPKNQNQREISFRYIKEPKSERVLVAIDISSQMKIQGRFVAAKNAFARFVYHDLPKGSNLSLIVFADDTNTTFVTAERLIDDVESRINYLESQPLPDEATLSENSCPECVLNDILDHIKENSDPAPHVILITTKLNINDMLYQSLVVDLRISEIRLHVFMFPSTPTTQNNMHSTWYSLCKETGNNFVSLGYDYLGNLYSSFSGVVQSTTKDVQITQEYLSTLDDEPLHFSIPVDDGVTKSLTVSLTGPSFDSDILKYDSTVLHDPENEVIYPQKQELIPAWLFQVSNPKKGKYTMRTWRRRQATSPILITATGRSSERDDIIAAKVWIETQDAETKFSQPPILIFCEVRKGIYPVLNATVRAYVYHPNNDGVSEIDLIDDGLGSTDITKHDGIYSRYFTNFTSVGLYTVRVKITGGYDTTTTVGRGPSSYCCGTIFPFAQQTSITQFSRGAGPATFKVTAVPNYDTYPPSKVTDLGITRSYEDKLYILQWSAVGSDYDQGIASAYEIKMFRDRSLVGNRFFNSGLEVYNVTIQTTEEASYGTQLYHTLTLMDTFENGLYYIGIRAVDEAGNYGEPSNAVPVWFHSRTTTSFIDCGGGPIALKFNSAMRNHLSSTVLYLFIIYILNFVVFRQNH